MPDRIIPSDFTNKLTRIKAELARRNGYGDVSLHATIAFPEGTPITVGSLITTPVYNTLLTALNYINGTGLPSEAVAGVTKINSADLNAVDAIISAFEAQPRSATSNSDCAAQCTGMCVAQCTTTCVGDCTGGCGDTCSVGCAANCLGTCTNACTNACTSCTGACTGTCTSCTGGCIGSCSGTCTKVCNWSCTGGCGGTCKGTCTGSCSSTCSSVNY